jgi:hypothetical protein
MASTSDGEGEAFAKAGVGEGIKSKRIAHELNEREVGRVASQARKMKRNERGKMGLIAWSSTGQTRGVIYAAGKDTTSLLRSDG